MRTGFILLFLAVAFLSLNACTKTDTNGPDTLNATIGATAFVSIGSGITENSAAGKYNFACTENNLTLNIILPSLTAGTYNYSATDNPGLQFGGGNNELYYTVRRGKPTSGSIIITDNSNSTITGTFTGVLYPSDTIYRDSVQITGKFNQMKY